MAESRWDCPRGQFPPALLFLSFGSLSV
jgi:hypothetical protein